MTTSRFDADDPKIVSIVAAVILDGAGNILLVRKRGTAAFMQPGGKMAQGETRIGALEREIAEELGCALDRSSCRALGRFSAAAANEPGWTVRADLYSARLSGQVRPAAEIEEALWIDPDDEGRVELAPLTLDHVLPLARELRARALR